MSSGTYRIDLVRTALSKAARRLEVLAKDRRSGANGINYLEALFNVRKLCRRSVSHRDDFVMVAPRQQLSKVSGVC